MTAEEKLWSDIQDLQDEIEELEESLDPLDQNLDGIPDSYIKFEGEFSYSLLDVNFDGELDVRWTYENDILISGIEDTDFDGFWETRYLARNGNIHLSYSDTDKNGIGDLYTRFVDGRFIFSERYFLKNNSAYIGRVEYDTYGYPMSSEEIKATNISECEFQNNFLSAGGL